MNYIALLVGLGLGVLWIISLSINAAAAWYTWLVFAAAIILVVFALYDISRTRGRPT